MISKELQNLQKLNLIIRKFISKNNNIWDISIYGSFVRGKKDARDIDVAIFLKKDISLKQKTDLAYELKERITEKTNLNVDIKTLSVRDFFDKTFVARQGILAETFLLKRKKFLSELLGFKNYYLFTYSLKGLSHSRKNLFNYTLKGRRKSKGLLKEKNSFFISISSLMVPIQNVEFFIDFFEKNKINYKIFKILIYK